MKRQDIIAGLEERAVYEAGMSDLYAHITPHHDTAEKHAGYANLFFVAAKALQSPEWVAIEDAPKNLHYIVHFRAVKVNINQTGRSYWDIHRGYVSEDGDFCDADNGEPYGWQPDDYSHYRPDLQPPEQSA